MPLLENPGWEQSGCRVTYLPVDEFGMLAPAQVEAAITPQTVLVTIMHGNNEVGTVEPIREIADIVHRHGALVHTDCAQSIGKIAVGVDDLGVDQRFGDFRLGRTVVAL